MHWDTLVWKVEALYDSIMLQQLLGIHPRNKRMSTNIILIILTWGTTPCWKDKPMAHMLENFFFSLVVRCLGDKCIHVLSWTLLDIVIIHAVIIYIITGSCTLKFNILYEHTQEVWHIVHTIHYRYSFSWW